MKKAYYLFICLLLIPFAIAQSIGTGLGNHTIVAKSDGTVYTWGDNHYGQLGNGSTGRNCNVPATVTAVLRGKIITTVAMGEYHTIALASDGTIYTWGLGADGQLGNGNNTDSDIPVAVTASGVLSGKTITAVAAGGNHSIALASDGTVYTWGNNDYGQLGNGDTAPSNVPAAVNANGVLSGKTITAVAAGEYHSIALASDGTVYTWGNNWYGQLGNGISGTGEKSNVPVAVTASGILSGKTITEVAAGCLHSVALASDGTVYTWGWNRYGELGNGNYDDSDVPAAVNANGVLSGKAITAVAAGYSHSIALSSDGTVYTWGKNDYGQLGNGCYVESNVPTTVISKGVLNGKTITSVGAGGHSIALASDGTVSAWGSNSYGQLGNSNTTDSNVPVSVAATGILIGKMITSVEAGSAHSIALASDGTIYTWGNNLYGQLGNGTSGVGQYCNVPVAVTTSGVLSGKTITLVAAGGFHSIALASDGTVYTWGNPDYGQLGNGYSGGTFNVPAAVDTSGELSGKTIIAVAAGDYHSIALASDGTVYTWGNNLYGQLGNGNNTSSDVPVAVTTSGALSGKTIIAVAAGGNHSLALTSDGTVYTWGDNNYGQLGNGNTGTNSNVPVAVTASGVLSGKTITAVTAGSGHSVALASDGKVYTWGFNGDGQLGNKNNTSRNVPVAVNTSGVLNGEIIIAVAAGQYHSIALASDGIVYSWGRNSESQLGNATSGAGTESNVPVEVYRDYMGHLPVETAPSVPTEFSLLQNYPNPFNPSTMISYQLPINGYVTLKVYNMLGQEVATLVNQHQSTGNYEVKFDASNLAAGIYLYKLQAGEYNRTMKMILMK